MFCHKSLLLVTIYVSYWVLQIQYVTYKNYKKELLNFDNTPCNY